MLRNADDLFQMRGARHQLPRVEVNKPAKGNAATKQDHSCVCKRHTRTTMEKIEGAEPSFRYHTLPWEPICPEITRVLSQDERPRA